VREDSTKVRIRPAHLGDIETIEGFIAGYGNDGTLLPRSRTNLLHYLRDFRVAETGGGQFVGCGALQLVNEGLAEVRSLAVDPAWRGSGIGSRIVRALIRDARRLGIVRIFCLTRRLDFFARNGFVAVPMERFPDKVWNDCRFCPRRDSCDETAMELVLNPSVHGSTVHRMRPSFSVASRLPASR
jgi:N-acetylglutamate synthase-like GNAT family acetyltransferase